MQIGYTLASEEHGPRELVELAVRAEQLGFDYVSISDHYHPWVPEQGNSPFVWSTLGGVAMATTRLGLGVGVSCPIMRIHPAIVAQAAATMAVMSGNRFFLGLGTGELLNEHVVAPKWPRIEVRREMLKESVEIIQRLWSGDVVDYGGRYFEVENVCLYTCPETPPPLYLSALGPSVAQMAAECGCGMWSTRPNRETVEVYRNAGGTGEVIGELIVCWANSEQEAVETALKRWPNAGLSGQLSQEVATPTLFVEACSTLRPEDVAKSVLCGPDPGRLMQAIDEYRKAGFTRCELHQVGLDQDVFFRAWTSELQQEVMAA